MIEQLPDHLLERTRIRDGKVVDDNASIQRFVLYWMRTAVRGDENPALDVARSIADRLGAPLLVYQAISPNYEYASDRHHTFMLQGARDVQTQIVSLGISYAFHLATGDDQRPHLISLANLASVVVTEDMPVDPPRRFLNALKGKTNTPIVTVDTACVAPMQLVCRPYTRAYKFRSATKKIYQERLLRPWPKLDIETKPFDLAQLPFEPIKLLDANLTDLVSRCEIDHAVGPVVDTEGGSAAGYRRWNTFKENRLSRYAKQRNNALMDGVSSMSPYLHYGMVSPLRIAREAAESDTAGSEKYLDELLIWRELAYTFCFYRDDHDKWSAIPDWARETLENHASDHRTTTYSWEQLARGETQDDFWNAAQKSLVMQGKLHNNVRMTWGKAILNWKKTPQEAFATIIDLNHRYALDGRDPASYGGILWCLGQFDRPFEPERQILGTIRPRPTSDHERRLDLPKYLAKVAEPRFDPVPHVAVIGAGLSGLFAARTLRDHGLRVSVFEKGRGVGGRMSTRRVAGANGEFTFDHGAQYFAARAPRFIRYIDSWMEQGIVAKWPDQQRGGDQRIVVLKDGAIKSESDSLDRFVAVPTMNSICKHLASNLDVQTQTQITQILPVTNGIELFNESGETLGQFDRLVVSAPAVQTANLLAHFPELASRISRMKMNPCWASMVAFEKPISDQWSGAFLHNSFLSWAARNNTKPGRNTGGEQLVIHASHPWTAEHWDHASDDVAEKMLAEFWNVSGISARSHMHSQAHRWKYAIPDQLDRAGYLHDQSDTVFACGDWLNGSRVEGAFLSGMATAGRILGTLLPSGRKELTQSRFFD